MYSVTAQVVRFMVHAGLFVNIFEFVGRYVFFIQGDIEFALDFRARSLYVRL